MNVDKIPRNVPEFCTDWPSFEHQHKASFILFSTRVRIPTYFVAFTFTQIHIIMNPFLLLLDMVGERIQNPTLWDGICRPRETHIIGLLKRVLELTIPCRESLRNLDPDLIYVISLNANQMYILQTRIFFRERK